MQIIENATIYKCEHCNYTDTLLGRMKSHENECLSKQLKASKNKDKRKIYNLLDIDIINKEIKIFFEKYNLPVSSEIEFAKIIIDNSCLPYLELDKSVKSIFDKSEFLLNHKLNDLRYSKEYLNAEFSEQLKEIVIMILIKEAELGALIEKEKIQH